jgi:hypothetical protein
MRKTGKPTCAARGAIQQQHKSSTTSAAQVSPAQDHRTPSSENISEGEFILIPFLARELDSTTSCDTFRPSSWTLRPPRRPWRAL